MLRVHFTIEDVARVRVAAAPDPLWEITNSFQVLLTRDSSLAFGEWRQLVRPRLPVGGGQLTGQLTGLLPSRGYSPDFLTPDLCGRYDLGSAVDTVLGTPRTVLRDDLVTLAESRDRSRPLPTGIRELADGAPSALHRLASALHGYHRHTLAPFWPQIRAQVDADRALRTRAVLAGGTDGLLRSFEPLLRWEPPVLVADYPVERELRLDGRGLLLQPSFFCHRRPVTLASPDMTPILVYPIQHTLGWTRRRARVGTGPAAELGALIGRTRAAVLEDVVTGRTTGELAERFGITGAAASYHTAVLRRAGLLLSVRRGKHVVHSITPAGQSLLDGPLETPFDV